MGKVEKTVFISYRRTNMPWALAIYQNLTAHGYDVFFDYDSIASGDFEQVILGNIKARAHFLVVLTPSALERCDNPDDWLRREIETALDEKRNIVPVFLEGFDFGSPAISKYLTGKLENLKKYNGQNVPADFFDEAMAKVRDKFLNVALDAVLHPVSSTVEKEVKKQQAAASGAAAVKENQLTAQEWAEKARAQIDQGEYNDAYFSASKAIELDQNYYFGYAKRGLASYNLKDLENAIKDYTDAVRLDPDDYDSYNNRGIAHKAQGDFDGAIKDYNEAIRIKSDYAQAYHNRGNAYYSKAYFDDAIKDYTQAIKINPDYFNAYWGRGSAWWEKKDYSSAAADYQKYFDLGGTDERVRQYLKDAKAKIDK